MSRTKPVELKKGRISNDEYRKRKESEEMLRGEKSISTTPPSYLCENGKKVYQNIVNSLPEQLLNNTDEYVVSVIADAVARMQECQALINKEGLLVEYTNSAGATNIDQNKAVLIYQKYCEIFKRYISEIGLSPSARSKIAMLNLQEEEEKTDPLLKALSGGKK